MRATWRGKVIAASEATVVVEGNHDFPEPKAAAETVRGRIAFWRGVEVTG